MVMTSAESWNDNPRAVGNFCEGKKGDAVSSLESLPWGVCSACRGWIWEAKSESFGLVLPTPGGGRIG
jgi:hypothetical protein